MNIFLRRFVKKHLQHISVLPLVLQLCLTFFLPTPVYYFGAKFGYFL